MIEFALLIKGRPGKLLFAEVSNLKIVVDAITLKLILTQEMYWIYFFSTIPSYDLNNRVDLSLAL